MLKFSRMPDLDAAKKEYNEILEQLSNPELLSNGEKLEDLLKKRDDFEKIIEKSQVIEEISQRIEENQEILSAEKDPELLSLAEGELQTLVERKRNLEEDLLAIEKGGVKRSGQEEPGSVIVEIRAGTGGDEACLFAADLFKMYFKYANSQGWKQKTLDSHPTELGGFKEVTFELKGNGVFSKTKYEGGVHRVQRIPKTEKSGRIHTSTTTVAVLPSPEKTQIKIEPRDLKIDFYRASGPGGQYVNRRETAVRITHLPTGLVVTSQTERNQLQNKENALAILGARLLERKEEEMSQKISGERKTQIGWAKRAEKIRTYNFPQDRLTDHRIKKSWHHIEEIMAGGLDPIIQTLQKKLG